MAAPSAICVPGGKSAEPRAWTGRGVRLLTAALLLALASCSRSTGRGDPPPGSSEPPLDAAPAEPRPEPSAAPPSSSAVAAPEAPPAPCEDLVRPGPVPASPELPRVDRARG